MLSFYLVGDFQRERQKMTFCALCLTPWPGSLICDKICLQWFLPWFPVYSTSHKAGHCHYFVLNLTFWWHGSTFVCEQTESHSKEPVTSPLYGMVPESNSQALSSDQGPPGAPMNYSNIYNPQEHQIEAQVRVEVNVYTEVIKVIYEVSWCYKIIKWTEFDINLVSHLHQCLCTSSWLVPWH